MARRLHGLVAFSGAALTWLDLPFPVMLIAGAAILGKWPPTGRWLMWIGASVLSVCLLPAYVLLLREMHFAHVDFLILLIDIGWIGTLILLPLFDVILVIDAFKGRSAPIFRFNRSASPCAGPIYIRFWRECTRCGANEMFSGQGVEWRKICEE